MFPRSSLLPLLDKTHSKHKTDITLIESTLAALSRITKSRPDLFSLFCSLCGSSSVKVKLKAYQLAIAHRQPDETILLHNQACKDLSNGNWNVALIAYHFLFYTQTNETFASDVLYLIQNEATRRSALNSLIYQNDLLARFGTKLLGNINYDSCDTVSKMRLIEFNSEIANQPVELANPLHQLDYIDICHRKHRRLDLEPEKLEPEIYFEFVVKGGDISLDTFRQKLSHFSTLYGDRTQLVTWTATLQNIGEIIKRRVLELQPHDIDRLIELDDDYVTYGLLVSYSELMKSSFNICIHLLYCRCDTLHSIHKSILAELFKLTQQEDAELYIELKDWSESMTSQVLQQN